MSRIFYEKLIWTDLVGINRSRVIVDEATETKVAKICFALPSYADVVSPDTSMQPVGEYRVIPVTPSNKLFPNDRFETRICEIYELDGKTPAPVCGRSLLKSALNEIKSEFNIDVEVGFELEFLLFDKSKGYCGEPLDYQRYATSRALCNPIAMQFLIEVCEVLKKNEISVLQFHAESASGQYEMAFKHCDALKAVDNIILAKEIIIRVAINYGLVVSFLPKLEPYQAGNAMHCHIGFTRDGENVFGKVNTAGGESLTAENTLTPLAEGFMAGVLNHLPALLAVTMSSPNSFSRLQPKCWAGAFQVWGVENRECPIRLCLASNNEPCNNFEFKSFDATANPYLGVAGIIFAGLGGIKKESKLPEPCSIEPSKFDGAVPLPCEATEAADNLHCDKYLNEKMGSVLIKAISAVRYEDQNGYSIDMLEQPSFRETY